jgi:DNA mismatch endonuclease (patch repair protein)
MADTFTKAERSRVMAAVKGRNTTPELTVRRMVHSLGYRYRIHVDRLPGCPDLVFPARRKIILVHGCFWHRHHCSAGQSMPATRVEYWSAKFARNQARDRRNRRALQRLGWSLLTVWECQTRVARQLALRERLVAFLDG